MKGVIPKVRAKFEMVMAPKGRAEFHASKGWAGEAMKRNVITLVFLVDPKKSRLDRT